MRWNTSLTILSLLIVGCGDKDPVDTGDTLSDVDGDGYTDDVDCDDNNAAVNPDAAEVCDGLDNDCDELLDDADDSLDTTTASTFYADADGDAYGDAASTTDACSQPSGYAAASGDCDDADGTVFPGAAEACDGQYNDCDDPSYAVGTPPADESDADADGYVTCDYDSTTWAGASAVVGGGDCDDGDATLNPGASEVCDGLDNDCDSLTDDADDSLDATTTGSTFYLDFDGDTYGDVANPTDACQQPTGYVTDSEDCDDTNAAINPDAPEIPQDGTDDNCDGYDGCSDLDCDGYTDLYSPSLSTGAYHEIFLGDGTSLTQDTTLTGCSTYDAAHGDINGDGYIDLVHANYGCSTDNSVFYGSATGYSDKNTEMFSNVYGFEVEVEDLNSDGYDDIVFGVYAGSNGYIYWGSASGATTYTELPAAFGWDVAIGDANGDGYKDVVFCSVTADSYLYYGSAKGYSVKDYALIEGSYSYGCHMDDLDSDGYPELILSGYSSSYDALVYWGSSTGYSTTSRTDLPATSSISYGITTGDYNADGYQDIFFSSWSSSTDSLLYYGSSTGYSSSDSASIATSLAFRSLSADLNSDGYDDLLIPSYDSGSSEVFLGSASGLPATADYSVPSGAAYNVSAADLDGDGYWEIFLPDYASSGNIDMYWGSASGWSSKDTDNLAGGTSPFSAPLLVGPGESARSE